MERQQFLEGIQERICRLPERGTRTGRLVLVCSLASNSSSIRMASA
jgi:hypothetical protein